ncbi:MAG TPA: transglycosylase SLT domain-containing protein [Gammaproteobacteria bacterium]
MRRLLASALAAWLLAAPGALGAEDEHAVARAEFLAAYKNAGAGDHHDSRALRRYPLYPYLQAARLEHALRAARGGWLDVDEQAREFLERHDGEPVGRRLRRAWLESLARRDLAEPLIEHYRAEAADASLQCRWLRARIAHGTAEDRKALVTDAVNRWLTPRRLPPDCEPVFEWLRATGGLTDDLVERRVHLLLEAGQPEFAKVVAKRLPAERAAPLLTWAELIRRPVAAIDALIASPSTPVLPEALLDGWTRLARSDPAAALERFEPLLAARRLDAAEADGLRQALALGLAWDRRPEALAQFEATQARDDYTLAWRVRAALWHGDWDTAEAAIAAMSDAERATPRWRYWAGRAAERRGDLAAAAALYESILPRDNYYSAQAAARLGRRVEPHLDPLPRDDALLEALGDHEFLVRARELLLVGMRPEAATEWLAGLAQLDEDARTQAIHLAADWGWHDIAIATATRQRVFFDYALLYPRPFDREVESAAKAQGIEVPLLYGLVRQESLYRPDAVSPAGAVGLAQLKPATAELVARRNGSVAPKADDLRDPARNLSLGAAYLKSLEQRFGGQTIVALAAYNAGPAAVERWLPLEPIETDIWIENIPFNETREYVQRVLWHSVVFAWLATGEPQDTRGWSQYVSAASERVARAGR